VTDTVAKPITHLNLVFIARKIYEPLPLSDAYLPTADTSTTMSTAVCFFFISCKEFRVVHNEELCNSYESASRPIVSVLTSRRLRSDGDVPQTGREETDIK
jgi:hypothetical protein